MTSPSSASGDRAARPPADPIAAVTHPDPYPYYRELVARTPLYRDEVQGLWVAASADAVTAVLTSALGRVRPAAEPVPAALLASPAADIFGRLPRPRARRPLGPAPRRGDRPAVEPGASGRVRARALRSRHRRSPPDARRGAGVGRAMRPPVHRRRVARGRRGTRRAGQGGGGASDRDDPIAVDRAGAGRDGRAARGPASGGEPRRMRRPGGRGECHRLPHPGLRGDRGPDRQYAPGSRGPSGRRRADRARARSPERGDPGSAPLRPAGPEHAPLHRGEWPGGGSADGGGRHGAGRAGGGQPRRGGESGPGAIRRHASAPADVHARRRSPRLSGRAARDHDRPGGGRAAARPRRRARVSRRGGDLSSLREPARPALRAGDRLSYRNTASFLRSISSKSIWAPRPGAVGARTMPCESTSMSATRPYFCASAGRSTSKNSQFRMAIATCRLATLLSELPP